MSSQEFSTRDQILFISYQDVIKMTYPLLLKTIISDYYDDLNSVLKLDKIKDYDLLNLERLCLERLDRNPLRYLARDEKYYELCDKLLDTFKTEFIEMYAQSGFTLLGAKIYNMCMLPMVKKIYIYTEEPIYQMVYDCKTYFSEYVDKITYISGDFIDVVKSLTDKPTTYIIDNIDFAKELLDNDMIAFTEILIPEVGYNLEMTEDFNIVLKYNMNNLMEEHIFKIGVFPLINLTKEHFSCMEEVKDAFNSNINNDI